MIVFFLGRQPEISLAELAAVHHQTPHLVDSHIAAMDITTSTALASANHLGAVVKIGEVIDADFIINKANLAKLAEHLFASTTGKVTIGISHYGHHITKTSAINFGRELQSILKAQGHSVRLLPNNAATLSTATVLHNGLASNNPKKVELSIIPGQTNSRVTIAQTIFVQDIDAYTFRDRRRPRRDAHNGMLPPKLAQTMINLAHGALKTKRGLNDDQLNVLDPFCGTGVVLQEATLMGMNVYGTDLNPDMIRNTKDNLAWLARTHHRQIQPNLAIGDATNFDWRNWAKPDHINLVATETYLGKPYTSTPPLAELGHNITACNLIIGKFLRNISGQLARGAGLCIGVPAWFIRDHIHHLPCVDQITDYGFTNMTQGANLIYHRPDQIVGRELLVLQKR